ncbi:hypothetical protein [Actinoplanes sp. NBRC 101535]|uniref:hypothetical protein n=1 Tax=Actinoplanes sp. NBRC 101535 TaxID=3032196 RepID=UPI0024A0C9B4|nr:hypothetical protein [Actinoplanes sp. NBRC 101535]GLY08331.1 hypothetical protein Acsp01_87100 [Actinoplanes sp. NBRC 101535]
MHPAHHTPAQIGITLIALAAMAAVIALLAEVEPLSCTLHEITSAQPGCSRASLGLTVYLAGGSTAYLAVLLSTRALLHRHDQHPEH